MDSLLELGFAALALYAFSAFCSLLVLWYVVRFIKNAWEGNTRTLWKMILAAVALLALALGSLALYIFGEAIDLKSLREPSLWAFSGVSWVSLLSFAVRAEWKERKRTGKRLFS